MVEDLTQKLILSGQIRHVDKLAQELEKRGYEVQKRYFRITEPVVLVRVGDKMGAAYVGSANIRRNFL